MSVIADKKLKVFFDDKVYILNLTMRSFKRYEEITNVGLAIDMDDILLGKIKEVKNFLKSTLRYTDRFYKDTTEEEIISDEDFENLLKDEMKFLYKMTTYARICLWENIKDEDEKNIQKKKKKKKHKKTKD